MKIFIRLEEERDYREVENITREAFWDLFRPGCNEHLLVHKLRTVPAFVKELDYVALDGDTIAGNIMYSKAKVVDDKGQAFEVLCMGPLCVLPSYQKKGIGAQLMEHSTKRARELGFRVVIIFGHPDYYHRFGFVNAERYGITTATGENLEPFMALELYEGALKGITGKFHEDPVFEVKDDELEVFEKGFPYKEKHVK